MPRLIISAGHSNDDPGVSANGLREVDLTRAISRKLIPYLRANGLITLSVPPNMDVAKRIEWINGTGYNAELKDISIEIHINDGGQSGLEFWYQGTGGNESQDLAEIIMENSSQELNVPNLGVKSEFDHEYGSLAFLSNTNTISVLCKCLAIDLPEDANKLKSEAEIDKIAKGIAKGILKFLNMPFREPAQRKKPSDIANRARSMAAQRPNTQQTTTPVPVPVPVNKNQVARPIKNRQAPAFQNNIARPAGTPSMTKSGPAMSRDDRKKLISTVYNKILGREPNDKDLNYFLNIGISEEKLMKRMMDSQEHLDIVKAKKEFDKMKEEFGSMKLRLIQLETGNKDQKIMLHKLSELLKQKNIHLSKSRLELNELKRNKPKNNDNVPERKYKGKLSDRMFHFFSGVLG